MRKSTSTAAAGLTCLAVVVLMLAATTTVTAAQSTDCLTPLLVCVSDLNTTKPSKDCCNAIRAVVSDSAEVACLCYYYKNPGDLGGLNITQALLLPKYCGLSVDPNTLCNAMAPSSSVPPPAPGNNDNNSAVRISWMGTAALFLVFSCLSFPHPFSNFIMK